MWRLCHIFTMTVGLLLTCHQLDTAMLGHLLDVALSLRWLAAGPGCRHPAEWVCSGGRPRQGVCPAHQARPGEEDLGKEAFLAPLARCTPCNLPATDGLSFFVSLLKSALFNTFVPFAFSCRPRCSIRRCTTWSRRWSTSARCPPATMRHGAWVSTGAQAYGEVSCVVVW